MSLTKVTYSMIDGAVANVLDFGAYNNGTNPTTTVNAIQSALDSGATCVYLPSGNYLVDETIYIPSGVTLMGEGGNVNQYTKATSGTVIVAESGTFTGQAAVLRAGDASELNSITIKNLVVDIQDAHSTAIGIRKETCNHFQMFNVWVLASFSASTQIAYFNGNGTHCYFENVNLYGGKISCYMDNTSGRECHDSVFNKIWMYPNPIAGATCLYFQGGNANSTWIMPYFETDTSGLVTGIYNENLTAPELTMIYPAWDGTFLYLWDSDYPPRTRFIGGNLSSFNAGFNGTFSRCTIVGRQGNQFVERLYLYDVGGESQFGVDSSGFNFGRISNGAAKISRIQGGKASSQVVGTVAAGASYQFTMTVSNGDVGNPVLVGFDWTGTTAIQLSGHMITDSTCRVTLTNLDSGSVDFGTREFKAVAINGSMT